MSDLENCEEEDGNGVKRNQEAPDSKVVAAPVFIRGGGERRRKMLAAILVVVLVVGGGVWVWMNYWKEPEPPETLCDG